MAGYVTGEDQDRDHKMSINTEASQNVSQLHLNDQGASESLWEAMHDTLAQATAPQPEEEEYYYDSDDLVVDLDAKCPEMVQWMVEWVEVKKARALLPPWCSGDFGESEHICYGREPHLSEVLNQAT